MKVICGKAKTCESGNNSKLQPKNDHLRFFKLEHRNILNPNQYLYFQCFHIILNYLLISLNQLDYVPPKLDLRIKYNQIYFHFNNLIIHED